MEVNINNRSKSLCDHTDEKPLHIGCHDRRWQFEKIGNFVLKSRLDARVCASLYLLTRSPRSQGKHWLMSLAFYPVAILRQCKQALRLMANFHVPLKQSEFAEFKI
jgi:hypothetical protein